MNNRPTLPPLHYLLWLPHCGTYIREAAPRQIIGTSNRRAALQLPEDQARRQALAVIRRTRQPVEMRQVEPAGRHRRGRERIVSTAGGAGTGDRKPRPFDPKNRDHWRELARPVRLFTYGGGEPWGSWFVQCAQPWRLSVQPALREGLNT